MSAIERLQRLMVSDRKLSQLVAVAVVTVVAFGLLAPDLFLSMRSFRSMAFQIPEIALLSLAVMVTMLTAGIDLSIVSTSNLSGLTAAYVVTSQLAPDGSNLTTVLVLAIVAALLVGVLAGLINGALISDVGVTPILATLATMTLYNGFAVGIRDGRSITGLPREFGLIGNGDVSGVPIPMIILVVTAFLLAIYINRTGLGLRTILLGSSETVARYSALPVRRIVITTYVISGFLSGLAGLLIAGRASSANPDYGASYLLLAIVIVVLGGVDPYGGFGRVTGVLLATFVLQAVATGFNALRFSQFFYQFAQGAILVGVMSLNNVLERRRLMRIPAQPPREPSGERAGAATGPSDP
jgi:simple sugar transport system permease protein